MATDKRFVVKNGLQTENINFVFNDAVLGSANITATMLSSNTLAFSGTTGQLFSITDSMTGVIFAVNDISGVPSIEVYDDGRITLAETFGNVTIGNSTISSSRTSTSTTTGILQVAGGAGITGNINVGGTRSLFTGSVGIGTSVPLGTNANVFSVYGSAMIYGNIDIANPAGGTSGIYFNDGSYQTTAFTGATTPSFGVAGTVQYAGAGNTFSGNSANFFWDNANTRLGIGTNSPTNVLTVRSTATPAWFNTVNSAVGSNNFEILVGNGTSTGTTVGYVNNTAVPYGYLSAGTTTRNITIAANGRVGIGGVTAPQVLLDVGGGAVIGASWAGNSNFINPPANGLSVQGSVGIGTYTPLNALDVRGGIGVTAASNFGGALTVASLSSNGAVSGTTGTFTSALYGASFNTGGTATVNALVSNGAISGTTITGTAGTFTSTQNSGLERAANIVSNTWIHATQNLTVASSNASTTSATGALVVTGGVGIGGRLNVAGNSYYAGILNTGSNLIAQSINSNTNVVGINIQSTGQATLASAVINTNITTSTLNSTGAAIVSSLNSNTNVVATNVQSTGQATVASLVVNAGTYTNSLNVNTTANVNALTSNTGITVSAGGVTVTGISRFAGNVSIAGNLNVSGAIFTDNANVLVVQNPIIYVGEDNPADLFDLGIVGSYTTTNYFHTGFVRNKDDDTWTLFDTLPSEPNVITGTIDWSNAWITYGRFKSGNIVVAGNTRSTSSADGAVVINGVGGLGVGGNINVGGTRNYFAGNVGIGVATPLSVLHVEGTTSGNGSGPDAIAYFKQNGTWTGAEPWALYVEGYSYLNGFRINASDGVRALYKTATGGTLGFATAGDDPITFTQLDNTERMRIAAGGFVGIGTTAPLSTLDVRGGLGITAASNFGGALSVASLTSNGAINGTTVTGTAGTFTSIQNSGLTRSANIVSNTWIHATQNLTVASSNTSTSTTTGAFVLSGGAGIAGAVHIGGLIYGASTLNIAGAARVNSLISNGTVTATTYYGASDSAYYLQPDGFSQLQTTYFTTSNTTNGYVQVTEDYIFGADSGNANTFILSTAADSYVKSTFRFGIGTDTPLSKLDVRGGIGATAASNIGGALAVASLTSNGAISGTTITGTAGTFTSIQNSGLTRSANIVSNTWIHATQNLTVASSNASTSTTTGAAVITGGVGIGGNINVGGTINSFTGNVGIGISNPTAKLNTYQTITSTLVPSAILGAAYSSGSLSHGLGFSINNNPVSAGMYVTEAGGSGANIIFTTATNYTSPTNTERMRIDSNGNVGIGTSTVQTGYKLQVQGGFAAITKSFVIDHPTKSGYKLQYASLEGPENGVYVRGRLKGVSRIELPDYWTGLIDESTITVNLTSIGRPQNLYVSDIDQNSIWIGAENDADIHCFYTVYAERKDIDKLVVEYGDR